MRGLVLSVLVSVLWTSTPVAHDDPEAKPYKSADAYQIYGLPLPQEESYGFANGTLIIREETVSNPEVPMPGLMPPPSPPCVTPEAGSQFKDAIADYNRLNNKTWLLQREFQLDKPYEIVSSNTIDALFKEGSWEGFYKRYPDSGGYIIMSAVGFNKEKTRAMVYMGSSCGLRCGRWGLHLFEKVHSKWKEVPGVTCNMMS